MIKYYLLILVIFSGKLFAQNTGCTPVVTITANKNNICLGTAVTFHAAVINNGTNTVYKWKKNNLDAGANNNSDYTAANFSEGDIVTCEYSCKTTCGTNADLFSNSITVHVINDITPIISVANNDSLICQGVLTLFTSEATYGNAIPSYQWMVNGNPVGFNQPDYTTDSITNGAQVKCILTISVPACPRTSRSSSSQMNIYVYPLIHPIIKITPTRTDICRGEQVTFTATANGSTSAMLSWELNGKPTGDAGPAITTSSLKDGDTVSCTLTINQDSRCHTATVAPSNKVGIHVKDYLDPTVAIAAPVLSACQGDQLSFTATVQHEGDYTSYSWLINDHYTNGNLSTFSNNRLADGDSVSCTISTHIPGCIITGNAISNYKVVMVKDTPVISFSPPGIEIMSGESAQLNAAVTGATASFIWKPDAILLTPQSLTSFTLPLNNDTAFILTVVAVNGCTASKELVVKILYKMHIPAAFTPNKDGHNDVFRIPPGSSVILKELLVFDRWGNVVFKTTDITKGWDGTYKDRDEDAGTYVYIIKGMIQGKLIFAKGTITLLR